MRMAGIARYRIVNSCAPRPFAGNPICVFLDEPDGSVMQSIATQMNQSCAIFPVRTGEDSYRMRLFTPEREVAYAGSPSLSAAWTMGDGVWTQTTSGAVARIEVKGDMAWMEQPQPIIEEIEEDDLIEGLGLRSIETIVRCTVASNSYVLAVTNDDPAGFAPRPDVLMRPATRFGPALVGAVVRHADDEIEARMFGPAHGVAEDPACGAVAGALGTLMHRHFGTSQTVSLRQGERIGRPSLITVDIGGPAIRVGGRQIAMGEGHVDLP
ncbi:phenazine biosynthesis protein PhzF family [Rhizorhabdus wittichii RW1]|uniref:Phenazine biosynthesis protein PhzF family n=1 Tax=Rhizorhabdus wittichii (strain DSM 6014 / CCUG 31198 / JCM 15750 / NBRC 105917 / EY 4224 / RW1) TaxID=392499 RepID=A0A9J9HB31_RHIWR|nr:phenazine biosynthesis protein PhzF family [Rhizorhabdus wittichii RW1]